jgi:hypothetical protein
MPDPIMFTEAAFLFSPEFTSRSKRPCPPGKQFETLTEMQGLDLNQLDPAVLREAAERCANCASRKPCRHWLRTGVFAYAGDPRCPNAALLHNWRETTR